MTKQAGRLTPSLEMLFSRSLEIGRSGLGVRSPKTPTSSRPRSTPESRGLAPDRSGFLTPRLAKPSPLLQRKRFLSARAASPAGLSPGIMSPNRLCSPRKESGDRFIPARTKLDLEQSNFLIAHKPSPKNLSVANSSATPKIKILTFSNDSTNRQEPKAGGAMFTIDEAYPKLKESKSPDKILDAPDITLDHTLTVMDWSNESQVALALEDVVYLWNSGTGETQMLCRTPDFSHVTSIRWNKAGGVLAVAGSDGKLNCWIKKTQKIVICQQHDYKVLSLAWNGQVLCSGDSRGFIFHHDMGMDEPSYIKVKGHLGGIACLAWSHSGFLLSSGCTQGVVKIWATKDITKTLHVLTNQTSAIRTLNWCPWLNSVFAMGTSSGYLCFWKISDTPIKVDSIKTDSEITDMKWSPNTKEIATSHTNSSIVIWNYPALRVLRKLKGHESRVVNLSLSPNVSRLASVGVDETLRLWSCFPKKVTPKKDTKIEGCIAKISLR